MVQAKRRRPWLDAALQWIKDHPGCFKTDVILGVNGGRKPPNQTVSSQSANLHKLLIEGLVINKAATPNRYELHAVEK